MLFPFILQCPQYGLKLLLFNQNDAFILTLDLGKNNLKLNYGTLLMLDLCSV